jgi:hypothetical protein
VNTVPAFTAGDLQAIRRVEELLRERDNPLAEEIYALGCMTGNELGTVETTIELVDGVPVRWLFDLAARLEEDNEEFLHVAGNLDGLIRGEPSASHMREVAASRWQEADNIRKFLKRRA